MHEEISQILAIHREQFPTATRPIIPMPPPVDAGQVFARHRQEAKKATSPLSRKKRNAALAAAREDAEREVTAETNARARARIEAQAAADELWLALERCDPDVTLAQLAAAFSDNDAAASAVGISGTEISLVVVVPSASAVPDRMPTLTQAGNLSLKKLTKTESADLYKSLVCGHLLVTLKEAFAAVPALTGAQIVAVRASETDVYGTTRPEVILAGHCDRTALEGVRWDDAESIQVFNQCLTSRLMLEVGSSKALQPIPTANEPELTALLDVIGFDDPTSS